MAEHHERREYNTKMAEDVAAMRADLATLVGPRGRIERLEDEAKAQWWVTVAISPVLLVLHGFARKFGIDV